MGWQDVVCLDGAQCAGEGGVKTDKDEGVCYSCKLNGKVCKAFKPLP